MRSLLIGFLTGALLLPSSGLSQQAGSSLPSAPSAASQSASQPAAESPKPVQPQALATDAAQQNPAPSTPAQPPAQEPQQENEGISTIRRSVNEVNVVFTVTDRHGRYIKDLTKEDIRILDDNKPPAEVRNFARETDLPLQVGLLVDASNSVRDRFKFEQESAIEFLNQTIRPKYDKAFIVGFDVTPEVTQDFTDSTEALSVGVRALRPGGGTAMYDALYFACRDKLLKEEHNTPVRKAIILLSDGDDNQSHVTGGEAIDMAQRAEVVVYTISTNISGTRNAGDKVLTKIAESTGGRAFFPFQINDVANAFAEIQDELRSQYAVSYKPSDFIANGRYHSIDISAVNHKGLHVRSRRGYYAPLE
jgi:VWFA-related protein